MSAGLYPIQVIAEFLGKRVEEIPVMVKEDGLPVIEVPAKTRNAQKVALLGMHRWVTGRSKNNPLTVDELEVELDRAAQAVAEKNRNKAERLKQRADAPVVGASV